MPARARLVGNRSITLANWKLTCEYKCKKKKNMKVASHYLKVYQPDIQPVVNDKFVQKSRLNCFVLQYCHSLQLLQSSF